MTDYPKCLECGDTRRETVTKKQRSATWAGGMKHDEVTLVVTRCYSCCSGFDVQQVS